MGIAKSYRTWTKKLPRGNGWNLVEIRLVRFPLQLCHCGDYQLGEFPIVVTRVKVLPHQLDIMIQIIQ